MTKRLLVFYCLCSIFSSGLTPPGGPTDLVRCHLAPETRHHTPLCLWVPSQWNRGCIIIYFEVGSNSSWGASHLPLSSLRGIDNYIFMFSPLVLSRSSLQGVEELSADARCSAILGIHYWSQTLSSLLFRSLPASSKDRKVEGYESLQLLVSAWTQFREC